MYVHVCAHVCTGMCVSEALKVYPERSSRGVLQHADDVSSRHLRFIFSTILDLQTHLNSYIFLNSYILSLLPFFFLLTFYTAMAHLL